MVLKRRDGHSVEALTEGEARHLGVSDVNQASATEAHALPAHMHDLLGSAQVLWGGSGAAVGAALFGVLALLLEAAVWLPTGFAAVVTADGAAMLIGGLPAGAGIGGLIGATIGMAFDLRNGVPAASKEQVIVVHSSDGSAHMERGSLSEGWHAGLRR